MKNFILIFSICISFAASAQELITFPSASTTANYSDPNIQSVSTMNPSTGITAVGCGTWLSATGYDETSLEDAMEYGDYWDFVASPASGKEIFINKITIKDVSSNLASPDVTASHFTIMYKLGFNGTWTQLTDLAPEKIGTNICTSGNSTYAISSSFSTVGNLYFRLVSWGESATQMRFGEIKIEGVVTDPIPGFPEIMMLKQSGKVVIGDTSVISTPGAYGLYVQEGILTESVKVALRNSSEWSDDAWDKEPTIADVKQSILDKKHLPSMPSADQLVKEGYELKAMDAKMLEQIEWLWLKVIELNKQIEELKTEK